MFFWVDGNNTGLVLSGVMAESETDTAELSDLSERINAARSAIVNYVGVIGARLIFASGDDVFFENDSPVDEEYIKNLYYSIAEQTCSISSGETVRDTANNMSIVKLHAHRGDNV